MHGGYVPSTRRTTMNQQFDTVQKFGKDGFDATVKAFGIASTGTQAIVVENADYARKSLEQGAATFEKLVGVNSLNKAIEIQAEYIQGAYKDLIAQATKNRELYTKLAQDSFEPFSALRSTAEAAMTPAKATPRAK
jgi:hypothetical protein